ncbi:MAG: hypothetical protein LUF92_03565, partial [Clostridiales bacterium]|nr:hypothetical protein [Clostridiales bacterium]
MEARADNESTANDKRPVNKVNTPYDDVFRTMTNNCRPLLIPVVNEIFGETYTGKEKISPSPNEHFLNKQDGFEDKRITDSCFTITGTDSKKYLMECQSNPDSSMLRRIFEYDTQIALDEGEVMQDTLKVTIPYTAILYLRANRSTPDKLHIEITFPEAVLSFDVRIIKITDYSLDDIFEKNLLFFIPFYIFHYGTKKQLDELEHDPEKLEMFKDELSMIVERLDALIEQKMLDMFHYKTILDMSTKVIDNLTAVYDNILEGLKGIIGV